MKDAKDQGFYNLPKAFLDRCLRSFILCYLYSHQNLRRVLLPAFLFSYICSYESRDFISP